MIHLLWCTVRTPIYIKVHNVWMNNCKNRGNIKSHVLVSTDDESKIIKDYFNSNNIDNRIEVYKPPYIGVCLPSYKLSSSLEFINDDIIIFASDDFIPPINWDDYVTKKFEEKGDGVLMVRDGYQKPDSSNMLHPAITIPIMKGSSLNKLNKIIYHPVYHHMFSDCELYQVTKDLGILIDDRIIDTTVFEHIHHTGGKRRADQFDRTYYNDWKMDENTWKKRQNMTLEEKLIV